MLAFLRGCLVWNLLLYYRNGREGMIRGAHLCGTNAESFMGIVAGSKSAILLDATEMVDSSFKPIGVR